MMATETEVATVVSALCGAFGKEPSELMCEAYFEALKDIPFETLKDSAKRAICELEYMPKIAKLREFAGIQQSSPDRAIRAFEVVRKTIAGHGSYRSVNFDDPVINATIRNMGGWLRICEMDAKEFEVWGRKEFETIYKSLCNARISAESASYLPGRAEKANECALTPPVVINCGLLPHPGIADKIKALPSETITEEQIAENKRKICELTRSVMS